MTDKATPICPNPACKAKFSHSGAMAQCIKCGLPDEIRDLGPRVIARWQKQKDRRYMTKNEAKRLKSVVARGSEHKRKNKPGRKGTKSAGLKAPRYKRKVKDPDYEPGAIA